MKRNLKMAAGMLLMSLIILAGCGKAAKGIPYTEANFESTVDDIMKLEGEDYESYYSVYYGTTYVYNKEYLGRNGKIKYMTDADGELCNVAWTCTTENAEQTDVLYKELYEAVQKDFGDPSDRSGVNNYGAVWKRSDGNIILSAMISEEINAVQVAFLNPKVSRDENGKLASDAGNAGNTSAAEQQADSQNETLKVTLEEIQTANSYENLLKNHKVVYYRAKQYANEDVDDGYLGFDDVIIENNNGDYSYESAAASQSVPFYDVIEKNEKGNYVEKTQFAGESIVETEYASEDEAKKALSRLWHFDSDEFAAETITSTEMMDDALVATTVRTPKGGEYASDVITRYYFMDPESLQVLAINEYMPTDTDYGTVFTEYHFTYDEEPDFTIEFAPEPEEGVSQEDYDNMSSPEDGEE